MAILISRRIITKCPSPLIPLVNTIHRNYSSAILPVPLKNSITNKSSCSSCCSNHFSREVPAWPWSISIPNLPSFSSLAVSKQAVDNEPTTTLASNFISRRFFCSHGNTATSAYSLFKPEDEKLMETSSSFKLGWKIDNFSEIDPVEGLFSKFKAGSCQWHAFVYPKGDPGEEAPYDQYLALYLLPVDLVGSGHMKFRIYMTDQNTDKSVGIADGEFEFCEEENDFEYVWNTLMPLTEFHDPDNGYLLNDTCIIKIEVSYMMEGEGSYAGDMKERNLQVQEAKRRHKYSYIDSDESE